MTVLTSPPLSTVLARLEADALASQHALERELGAMSPEARAALWASATSDYRAFYGRAKEAHLAVSPTTGKLLYMLARSTGARNIVEFGTITSSRRSFRSRVMRKSTRSTRPSSDPTRMRSPGEKGCSARR